MKTPAISNPVNLTAGNASSAKPSDGTPDVPFGQVLSREMAARPKAAEPPRSNAAQPPRPEAKSANARPATGSKAGGTDDKKPDAAATAQAATTGAAQAEADTEVQDQDAGATVSAASAELLALVASLTRPAEQVAGGDAKDAGLADDNIPPAADAALQGLNPSLAAAGLPRSAANTEPASDGATPDAGLNAVNGGSGKARDIAARADMAASSEIEPRSRDSGAGLAQAKDANPASGNDLAKVLAGRDGSGQAELAALRTDPDALAAKAMQGAQQAGPAPLNIGALSQAQLQQAQAAPGHMADRLAPRVGTPGWDQALGQKVVWMIGGDQQSASLTLNPPDLGPLQVVLSVSDSQATASFTAAQPEVRQALEAAMPKLRDMLGEAGIQLGQANVSAGTPNDQQNASGQPQQASRHSARPDDSAAPQVRVTQAISGGQGLVDTFA